MKTKLTILVALFAFIATSARSQTYKANFSTQLTLAGGGANPLQSLTIKAATGTTPYTLIMPASVAAAAGYILTSDASGNLSWTNPATGITLAGDVTGQAGSNTIATSAGNDIVAALNNSATTAALNVPVGVTATSLTSTGGLTTSGGAANLSTTDASAVNIGTGSNANAIGIGNGNGTSGTYSTTTFAGLVNFTGTVSLPAGSVTASSIALAQNNMFVGDASGHASALAPTNSSVLITDGSGVPQWSTALPNSYLANSGLTVTAGTGLSGGGAVSLGGSTTLTLDMTNANTWTALQTFSDGLTASGGTASINNTGSNAVNIGAGGTYTGTITIGDSAIGNVSTTDINGAVNFGGPVSFPAGSVSANSLGLASGDVFVGNASNHAAAVALSQDVTIDNTGKATVNSSNAATFAVTNNATVGGTLGVTGQTTLGSTALSSVTLTAPSGATLALGSASSLYILNDAGASETYTSITGANAAAGQVIVIYNASTTPADYITLTSGPGLTLNGGNVIIADGGSVQLIYAGASWRLLGQ